jgi:hypothetical protein
VEASFGISEMIKHFRMRACLAGVIELLDEAISVAANRMLSEAPFA